MRHFFGKITLDPSCNALFTSSLFTWVFKKISSPHSLISNKVASAHQDILKKYLVKRGFRRGLLFCKMLPYKNTPKNKIITTGFLGLLVFFSVFFSQKSLAASVCVVSGANYSPSTTYIQHGSSSAIYCKSGFYTSLFTTSFNTSCNNGTVSGVAPCTAFCSVDSLKTEIGTNDHSITLAGADFTAKMASVNQTLSVKCISKAGNVFDNYSTTCASNGRFSQVRGCYNTEISCKKADGTLGITMKINASRNQSAELNNGDNYQITCLGGYYSNIVGSRGSSYALNCVDGAIPNKQSCVKKCNLSNLSYLGDIDAKSLFSRKSVIDVSNEIIEADESVNVWCKPKDGYNYAMIHQTRLNAFEQVKFSCNTGGYFRSNDEVTTCTKIDCSNAELTIRETIPNSLPPEFKQGITRNEKQFACPVGFEREAVESKLPLCKNGAWQNATSVKCKASSTALKPHGGLSLEPTGCQIGLGAFPNASVSGLSYDKSFAKIPSGETRTVTCTQTLNAETKSKMVIDTNYSTDYDQTFNIFCSHGRIFEGTNETNKVEISKTCHPTCNVERITLGNNKLESVTLNWANIVRKYFHPGEVLRVGCKWGYGSGETKSTFYNATCGTSGVFDKEYKCVSNFTDCSNDDLKKYVNTDRVDISSIYSGTTPAGDFFTPACKTGYNTPTTAVCVNGTWKVNGLNIPTEADSIYGSSTAVTCMKDCNYDDIQQTFITKVTPPSKIFKYGELIRRSCIPTSSGISYYNFQNFSTCLNGTWSNYLTCQRYFNFSKKNFNEKGIVSDEIWYNLFDDYPNSTIDNGNDSGLIKGPREYKLRCPTGNPAWVIKEVKETCLISLGIVCADLETSTVYYASYVAEGKIKVDAESGVKVPYSSTKDGSADVVDFIQGMQDGIKSIPVIGPVIDFFSNGLCFINCPSNTSEDLGLICYR